MSRCSYAEALERLDLLSHLAAYDPHVAGTPPLGIALATSDIDVLCHAPDASAFTEDVWRHFGREAGFRMQQWTADERPVIAAFDAHGWAFELFGHPRPVREQAGWRHFLVERRLLDLGGEAFRAAVMQQRQNDSKTEPAFAAALGLSGDPYTKLLELEQQADADFVALLESAGFAR
jgi:hypothetical protein